MQKYAIITLSTIILLITFLLKCSLPLDPREDFKNAKIALLPIETPQSGFISGDTVRFNVVVTLPNLFSSISLNTKDIENKISLNIETKENDTIIISQVFTNPDTLNISINAILKNGDKLTISTSVIINGIKPVINNRLEPLTYVKTASSCTLSIVANGTAPLYYNWYHDSTNLSNATPNLVISNFNKQNEGTYKCIVSNKWGADTSTNAVVILSDSTNTSIKWTIDTLKYSLSEGDSLKIRLLDYYQKQPSQTINVTFLGQNKSKIIVNDSLCSFIAGHRDSGKYEIPLLLSDSKSNDLLTIIITVLPRHFTLTVTADSGSVIISPQLSQYRWGDTVQFNAVPKAGFVFYQWDGDLQGNLNSIIRIVDTNLTIIARFWPEQNSECQKVIDYKLNETIIKYSPFLYRPKQLCPDPGFYDNGSKRINGGVRIVLQK